MNINKNLLPDESVIFRTKKTLMVFYVPVIFLLIAVFFTMDAQIPNVVNAQVELITNHLPYLRGIHNLVPIFFLVLALYAAIRPALLYLTSDYVVTNKRIMMRQGFFDKFSSDTRMSTISHVTVDQGPMGQLMNYGDISIFSFGGTTDTFWQISNPSGFQKSVHSQLDQSKMPA
jgi:membrane protein YdbS with pleckstrin-like domain